MSNQRILFISKQYYSLEDGFLFPKFSQQVAALENLGFNVYHVVIKSGYYCVINNSESSCYKIGKIPPRNKLFNLTIYIAMYRNILRWLHKNPQLFELIYIRKMPFEFFAMRMVKEIKKCSVNIVMEIPTYPFREELENEKRKLVRVFYKIAKPFELRIFSYIDLFTLIGESTESFYGKRAINIENGVSLSEIPFANINHSYFSDKTLNLLAIGNIAKWHGYERLIRSMKSFNISEHKIILHIVGADGDGSLAEIKKLVKSLELEEVVIFYGPLYGKNLDLLFDKIDMAVGPLGYYKCFNFAPVSLKTREFIARGIPFVMGGKDSAIPSGEFYLEVSNDASLIDCEKVLQFYLWFISHPDIRIKMREFAGTHLSWEKQFMKVFMALEEVK